MPNPRSGFTLVEVLLATVIITAGISALLSTLAASAALAGDGRRMGRAAILLASRADELRASIATAPGCSAPPPGSAAGTEGMSLAWSAARRGNVVDLILEARYRRAGRPVADTLATAVACP